MSNGNAALNVCLDTAQRHKAAVGALLLLANSCAEVCVCVCVHVVVRACV